MKGRVDGPDKVTGRARYAFEHPVDGAAYVWAVSSVIAKGLIRSVDASAALALPGVLAVITPDNAPRLPGSGDPELALFQSRAVAYRGQFVAAVVADTLETAREAAGQVRIEYQQAAHDVTLTQSHPGLYKPDYVNPRSETDTAVGDFDGAFAAAAVRVDATYRTPAEHNNPMEPHASIAAWQGDTLTLYDATQGPSRAAGQIAAVFGLEPSGVRVIAEHVGGGFGAKGMPRANVVLAAMAARVIGRPVKCAVTRPQMFAVTGHRAPSIQRVRLAPARTAGSWRCAMTSSIRPPRSRSSPSSRRWPPGTCTPRRTGAPPTVWSGLTCPLRPGCERRVSARGCSLWNRPWTSWPRPAASTRWTCGY